MPLQFDATVRLLQPPKIFIDKDNQVHVIDTHGEMQLERIMSPNTLLAYIEAARRAYAEWEAGR